jgi:hypothetical protein
MGQKRNVYSVLVGEIEEKRLLRTPRHRWGDNIKMNLRKIGWGDIWTRLMWLRIGTNRGLMGTVINFWVP